MADAKAKAEVTVVEMTDGRKVNFAGKRKVNKETLIDETKIESDGNVTQLSAGAIKIRMDFRNGETRTLDLPLSLLAKFAGHGAEQKFGDELASPADKPLSEDDMVVAIDDLYQVISAGKWGRGRAEGGGGVSGASIVVRAIMEVKGWDAERVKTNLQKLLDNDTSLTRRALYDSFKAEGTLTGEVIKRMESEKVKKEAKVDANAALAAME